MNKKLKIALAQIKTIEENKEANLLSIEQSIEEAYSKGAELLVLPEMVLTGFTKKERLKELAEPRLGESLLRVRKKLKEFPMSVVYSFPEYVSDDEIYNTTCIIDSEGTPVDFYRKIHLFDGEKNLVRSGSNWIVTNLEGIKVGILTCFDLEIPEAARALALKGAEVIVAPSANMTPYEHFHRTFITSRAIENHVFVAYCNRIGENAFYQYKGNSAVINPFGEVLMELESNKRDVQVTEIDLSQIEDSKKVYNYLHERRHELYS